MSEAFQLGPVSQPRAPDDVRADDWQTRFGAGATRESGFYDMFQALQAETYKPDPAWRLDEFMTRRPELTPELELFSGAESELEAQAIAKKIDAEKKRNAILQSGGVAGFMGSLTGSIGSPSTFIPVLGAVGRLRTAASITATSIGAAALDETILQQTQLTRTREEAFANVFGAALLGAALGGGVAMLTKGERAAAAKNVVKDGTTVLDPVVPPALMDRSMGAAEVNPLIDPGQLAGVLGRGEEGSAAARFQDRIVRMNARISPVTRGLTSEEPTVRALQAQIADANLPFRSGETVAPGGTVEGRTNYLINHHIQQTDGALQSLYTKYRTGKEGGTIRKQGALLAGVTPGMNGQKLSVDQFHEQVSLEMEVPQANQIPEVVEAAKEVRKMYDTLTNEMVKVGLLKAEDIGELPGGINYLNRVYDKEAIIRKSQAFEDMVARSYQKHLADAYARRTEGIAERKVKDEEEIGLLSLDEAAATTRLKEIKGEKAALREAEERTFELQGELTEAKADLRKLLKVASGQRKPDNTEAEMLRARIKDLEEELGRPLNAPIVEQNKKLARESRILSRSIGNLEARQQAALDGLDKNLDRSVHILRSITKKAAKFEQEMVRLSDEEYARGVAELESDMNIALEKLDEIDASSDKLRKEFPELASGPAGYDTRIQRFRREVFKGGSLKVSTEAERTEAIQRIDDALNDSVGDATGPDEYVVYHGTREQFDKFDMSRVGSGVGQFDDSFGMFFTTNANSARLFSYLAQPFKSAKEKGKQRVVKAKVTMKNPIVIDAKGENYPYELIAQELKRLNIEHWTSRKDSYKTREAILAAGYDGIIVRNAKVGGVSKNAAKNAGELPETFDTFIALTNDSINTGKWTSAQRASLEKLRDDIASARIVDEDQLAEVGANLWKGEAQGLDLRDSLSKTAKLLDDAADEGPEFARGVLKEFYDDALRAVDQRLEVHNERRARLRDRFVKADPEQARKRISSMEARLIARDEGLKDWLRERGGVINEDGSVDFSDGAKDYARQVRQGIEGDPTKMPGLERMVGARGPELARVLDLPVEEVAEFTERDVSKLIHIFTRTVIPDTELVRAGMGLRGEGIAPKVMEAYEKIKADVPNRVPEKVKAKGPEAEQAWIEKENVRITVERNNHLRDFEGQIERLRHTRGIPANPDSYLYAAGRNLAAYNTTIMMGNVLLSQLVDGAIAVQRYGLLDTFKHAFLPMIRGVKEFRMTKREALYYGMNELTYQSRLYQISDMFDATHRPMGRSGKAINFLANKMGIIGLFSVWNQHAKTALTPLAAGKILDAVDTFVSQRKVSAKEYERVLDTLRRAHIDGDLAQRIYAQKDTGGLVKHNGLWVPNTQSWTDSGAVDAFRTAVLADIDSVIVTPGVERPLFTDMNMPAKLITQFQSFMWSSHTKVVMAMLQEPDRRILEAFLATTFFGAVSYYADMTLRGRSEELENMTPGDWADNILARSPFLGVLSGAQRVAETIPGVKPYITFSDEGSDVRRWGQGPIGAAFGPSVGTGTKISKIMKEIDDPTQSTANTAKQLMPFNNVFYMRWLFDSVSQSSGLPETRGD